MDTKIKDLSQLLDLRKNELDNNETYKLKIQEIHKYLSKYPIFSRICDVLQGSNNVHLVDESAKEIEELVNISKTMTDKYNEQIILNYDQQDEIESEKKKLRLMKNNIIELYDKKFNRGIIVAEYDLSPIIQELGFIQNMFEKIMEEICPNTEKKNNMDKCNGYFEELSESIGYFKETLQKQQSENANIEMEYTCSVLEKEKNILEQQLEEYKKQHIDNTNLKEKLQTFVDIVNDQNIMIEEFKKNMKILEESFINRKNKLYKKLESILQIISSRLNNNIGDQYRQLLQQITIEFNTTSKDNHVKKDEALTSMEIKLDNINKEIEEIILRQAQINVNDGGLIETIIEMRDEINKKNSALIKMQNSIFDNNNQKKIEELENIIESKTRIISDLEKKIDIFDNDDTIFTYIN